MVVLFSGFKLRRNFMKDLQVECELDGGSGGCQSGFYSVWVVLFLPSPPLHWIMNDLQGDRDWTCMPLGGLGVRVPTSVQARQGLTNGSAVFLIPVVSRASFLFCCEADTVPGATGSRGHWICS